MVVKIGANFGERHVVAKLDLLPHALGKAGIVGIHGHFFLGLFGLFPLLFQTLFFLFGHVGFNGLFIRNARKFGKVAERRHYVVHHGYV